MKIEEINEWKIAALIEGDIEDAKYEIMKLVAVAKAAKKYMKGVQERRPEFIPFESLVEALEELEKE